MAAPHAVGVAALIASQFGTTDPVNGGLTMAPAEVEKILRATAGDVACPEPRLYHYPDPALNGTLDATCEGDSAFNGFYGDGIANALAAVSYTAPAGPVPPPSPVFKPRVRPAKVSASTRGRRRGRGLSLRVSGRLTPPAGVAVADACEGALTVVVSTSRRRTLASRVAQLRGDCSYSKTIRFARRSRLSRRLRVRVTFYGNDALLPRQAALKKPRVPRG